MLELTTARIIVDHALGHARDNGFPPMTIAVLDGGGQLVAFAREDNSSLLREKIARAKAAGALNMGVGTRALAERAVQHPSFISAITMLAQGEIIPAAGGVLVRDPASGAVIGAVGVSGHRPDEDEACALAGIGAAHLTADPG